MNKRVKWMMVVSMVLLAATPALALETKLSGFYQIMAAADNFAASNNYVGTFQDNAKSENVIDQRIRMKLDGKMNDNLSFVYYGEIDFQWGDNSYDTQRNDGGAIGGDTVNFETKNAYFDVKFDNADAAARLGLQGFYDRMDQVFFATDMAGAKFDFNVGGVGLTAGGFKLIDDDYAANPNNYPKSDSAYLWGLQADLPSSGKLSTSADYYYFQNRGVAGYPVFFGTADMEQVNFDGPGWTSDRSDMDLHFIGLKAVYQFTEETSIYGWVFYNNGTVDDIENNTTIPGGLEDIDVDGYAATVRAATKVGSVDASARLFFFSGDDDLSDGDAGFFANPLGVESYAFGDDGFMIFFQDANWANIGQYGFALMDAAYAGYGLLGGNVVANISPVDKLSIKGGVGYFASLEDKIAANDPRISRAGTALGTEAFVRVGYTMYDYLNVSVNGAYAWLGDFYDNDGGGTSIDDPASDVDNPYEVYLLAQFSFN